MSGHIAADDEHDTGASYAALQAIVRLTVEMSRARTSVEIYALALEGARGALAVECAAIVLFDGNGCARIEASAGLSAAYADGGTSPWLPGATDPRPTQIADLTSDPESHRALIAEGIQSVAYVPLVGTSGLLGHLLVGHTSPRVLGAAALGVAQTVATQLALSIERSRADQALRASEARLREAQSIAQIGSFYFDGRTQKVTWSDELYRIYGRDPATFQPTYESYVGAMQPADRARVVVALQLALSDATPFAIDYQVTLPDGSLRWMQARVRAVLGDEGAVLGLSGTCQDITERRAAEEAIRDRDERFQQLVETIHEGVWMTNASVDMVQYVSPVCARIFGLDHATLVTANRAIWSSLHPGDRERVQTAMTTRLAEDPIDQVFRVRRSDGMVRWVHLRGFPVRDAEGVVRRVAGVVEDITERRELEAQLRQSHKMEALGTLSGGIAHDFNNVLGAIVGNVGLAQMDLERNHPACESLAEAEKACERASALVRQILMFSRRQVAERNYVSLAEVVREAVKFMRATLPATIEIVGTIPPTVPRVLADSTEMHQVLVNLCTNAWHAIAGSGRIAVDLRGPGQLDPNDLPGLPAGPLVCLEVSDTGQGIEPATLERMFEPFFTTKLAGEGTGLGLAVVHGIVTAHGGAIRVASRPGHGTTFRVYFPAAESTASPEATTPRKVGPGRGQRILHVDDEIALTHVVARTLERLGYQVTSHQAPEAAFDALVAEPDGFDLLVTDLSMPTWSGLQLAARALALRPALPIVLLSGHATEADTDEALRLGVRKVMHKPVTAAALGECVAGIFG